jgi:hypothetical protein
MSEPDNTEHGDDLQDDDANQEKKDSESVDSAGAQDAAEHLKDAFKTQE